MEQYYKQDEVLTILGVKPPELANLISQGKLRELTIYGEPVYPQGDIEALVIEDQVPPSRLEFRELTAQLQQVQNQLELLQMSMGITGRPRERTSEELNLLLRETTTLLGYKEWTPRTLVDVTTELSSLTETDMRFYLRNRGSRSFLPFVTCLTRMLQYVEAHEDYPGRGFDILAQKIESARQRLTGLVYRVSADNPDLLGNDLRANVRRVLKLYAPLDSHISSYVARYLESTPKF